MEIWVGIKISANSVNIVKTECDDHRSIKIVDDTNWNLQSGERSDAYRLMYERVLNYLQENKVAFVILKATAINPRGTKVGHLEAAELRGVIMAASAQSCAEVITVQKASISKTFGQRKVDEYIKDDDFWEERISGDLRKGSRETVMLILSARK